MPPTPIMDLETLDCDRVLYDKAQIYEVLPQRYEFAQLDAIIHADVESALFAAYRDVRDDEWWCRGHMPRQAIFPGVLMVECAAQLSAFAQQMILPTEGYIMGFAGIDQAKFRDSIYPPGRIILIGHATEIRLRRFRCHVQAFVDGSMAFDGQISGIRLKI